MPRPTVRCTELSHARDRSSGRVAVTGVAGDGDPMPCRPLDAQVSNRPDLQSPPASSENNGDGGLSVRASHDGSTRLAGGVVAGFG
jgi:hypothetical protein